MNKNSVDHVDRKTVKAKAENNPCQPDFEDKFRRRFHKVSLCVLDRTRAALGTGHVFATVRRSFCIQAKSNKHTEAVLLP